MVRLPVKKTTRLLEGESRSKLVGCNNTSFLFAKLQNKSQSYSPYLVQSQLFYIIFTHEQHITEKLFVLLQCCSQMLQQNLCGK